MSRISPVLYRDIEKFLLSIYNMDSEDARRHIARNANLPEYLLNQIDWGKQPRQDFVPHLMDHALAWGSFSLEDPRHALVEYLKVTKNLGGGEHQQSLLILLEKLVDEIAASETMGNKPLPIPEVKFVNREREIRDITDELAVSPRYAIHAPAGYGKTWLLVQLQQEFHKEGWLTFFASANKETSILTLTNSLLSSSGLPNLSDNVSVDTATLADQFAGELKSSWQQIRKVPKGIVLLIDFEELPKDIRVFFNDLVRNWLPIIIKNVYGLQIFSNEKSRLRIILSGRFFNNDIQRILQYSEVQFRFNSLTPLVDRVLERCVNEYLPMLSPEWRVQLWSGLFYFTGGHPGCTSKILQLYWRKQQPEPNQFYSSNIKEIQEMIRNEVNIILRDFPESTKQLLLALSPFRYLSYGILEDILEHEPRILDWTERPSDLADFLTKTHLVSWDESGYLLKDDIVRRIMSLHMRYSDDQHLLFTTRCTQARDIYRSRLTEKQDTDTAPPTRWAIEYLYQSLQMKISKILTIEARTELRHSFWGTSDELAPDLGTDLHDCLSMLVNERNAQVQIDALQHALNIEREWEFHFTLNYYLRDETYETKWFGILLTKIRAFLFERLDK